MAKILIVDDSAFACVRLKLLFESRGHEVVGHTEDPKQALGLYKTLHPELVTLDYLMTDKSGEEVLKEIMQYDPDAKVIMISGSSDTSISEKVLQAGARAFVEKFDSKIEILEVIDRVIET